MKTAFLTLIALLFSNPAFALSCSAPEFYVIAGNTIHYVNIRSAGSDRELAGVDVASFKVIAGKERKPPPLRMPIPPLNGCGGDDYGVDRRHAYFQELPIPGADPASFEPLYYPFARDKSSVFFKAEKLNGADPQSFADVQYVPHLMEDAAHYFCGVHVFDKAVSSVVGEGIVKDNQKMCRAFELMDTGGADLKNYQPYASGYGHDGKNVYMLSDDTGKKGALVKIPGADPGSFKLMMSPFGGGSCAFTKDKAHVFYKPTLAHGVQIVEGADAASFACAACPRLETNEICARDSRATYIGTNYPDEARVIRTPLPK